MKATADSITIMGSRILGRRSEASVLTSALRCVRLCGVVPPENPGTLYRCARIIELTAAGGLRWGNTLTWREVITPSSFTRGMGGPQQRYSAETHCNTRLGRASLVNSSSQELDFLDHTDWATFLLSRRSGAGLVRSGAVEITEASFFRQRAGTSSNSWFSRKGDIIQAISSWQPSIIACRNDARRNSHERRSLAKI
jgi:hypothetical protein